MCCCPLVLTSGQVIGYIYKTNHIIFLVATFEKPGVHFKNHGIDFPVPKETPYRTTPAAVKAIISVHIINKPTRDDCRGVLTN